jgi:hypothetical protein
MHRTRVRHVMPYTQNSYDFPQTGERSHRSLGMPRHPSAETVLCYSPIGSANTTLCRCALVSITLDYDQRMERRDQLHPEATDTQKGGSFLGRIFPRNEECVPYRLGNTSRYSTRRTTCSLFLTFQGMVFESVRNTFIIRRTHHAMSYMRNRASARFGLLPQLWHSYTLQCLSSGR